MDAAKPSPAPSRARRWLRVTYTPAAISTTVSMGSTILRSLISRYAVCALTRYLAENSVNVGLMVGSFLTSVKPRALRFCLTTSMNGARPIVTCPLLTLIDPPPRPDSAFTIS